MLFSTGAYIAEVGIDRETGTVEFMDYCTRVPTISTLERRRGMPA